MVDRGFDQADGLRRMFGGTRTRVLDIVSGVAGVGRTSVAVNLGAALARAGRNTLLVDFVAEHAASRLHRYFGVPRSSDAASGAVALPVAQGCGVAALSHREWMQVGPMSASAFARSGSAQEPVVHDWVLVCGAGVEPVVVSDESERQVLVVLSAAAASITDAYGLLKRIATADRRCRYFVAVNRVASSRAASRIFENMAQVARGYLDVKLEYIGFVPTDPAIQRAANDGMSVLDGEPASPAAQAFVRIAERIASAAKPGTAHLRRTPEPAIELGAA